MENKVIRKAHLLPVSLKVASWNFNGRYMNDFWATTLDSGDKDKKDFSDREFLKITHL